ncbi:MAG TPA: hypothetical protein VGJ05_20840 [Fimbriiglobus sp.]|jgi:hypothetical protein
MSAVRFLLLAGVIAAAVPAVADKLRAGQPPAEGEPGLAAKAKDALNAVGYFAVENKSFAETIAYLKLRGKIDIQVDGDAVVLAGINPNQAGITFALRDVKLRDALAQVLTPYHLYYGVVGGKVVVSTEDTVIRKQLRQRVSIAPGTIGTLVKQLADQTGANVVLDPRQKKFAAEAQSDLVLTDVPLETAVRLASEVAGMKAVRMGNVLFVTSEARGDKLRADADGPTQPAVPKSVYPQVLNVIPAVPVPSGPGGTIPPAGPGGR